MQLQRLADEDTEVAARMLEQEKRRLHKEQVERERAAHEDAQLARQLHEEERQAILKRLKDLVSDAHRRQPRSDVISHTLLYIHVLC